VPEKTELGLPGVDSSGAWVGKHLRHTGDPLVALAGLGKAWNGSSSTMAARRRWKALANVAGAPRVRHT